MSYDDEVDYDSDTDDDEEITWINCKTCAAAFSSKEKGISELYSLCSNCSEHDRGESNRLCESDKVNDNRLSYEEVKAKEAAEDKAWEKDLGKYFQCCVNGCIRMIVEERCECFYNSHDYMFCAEHFECTHHDASNISKRPKEMETLLSTAPPPIDDGKPPGTPPPPIDVGETKEMETSPSTSPPPIDDGKPPGTRKPPGTPPSPIDNGKPPITRKPPGTPPPPINDGTTPPPPGGCIPPHALHGPALPLRFIESFVSDERSIELLLGGVSQVNVKKAFKMDSCDVVRLYLDLEMVDKIPLLYNYFILSAHFNKSIKQLYYSKVIVKNGSGLKFLVGCFLRTKCIKPRYDAILIPVTSPDRPFRVQTLTSFKKQYTYIPDEDIGEGATEYITNTLITFFKAQGM
jgi:hypothetical protein